jgi:tRNA nucleotidyltransferase (CCA-adding enzyme)
MNTSLQTKRDWETQFDRWSQPPGKTETDRCDNAVNSVKNAIKRSTKLSNRTIKAFPQGSYRNRVNVRRDSDVDVGVMCSDSYFVDYPHGKSAASTLTRKSFHL